MSEPKWSPEPDARAFGQISHDDFRHDWPIGQCGPCLAFGDRLRYETVGLDAVRAILARSSEMSA